MCKIDLHICCGILASVSSKPREQLVAEWAQRLKRLGLADAAQTLLPILRPMGALASQMLWMGQPIASGLAAQGLVEELALLLEDPDALDGLEQQLGLGLEQDNTHPA
jgi:hypothetical protein